MNDEVKAAAARFSDALVLQIKAEMGRRDMSTRALARKIGESSQYMSMRLDGGNPRTGIRVPLTVRDLAAIASALGLEPNDLIVRAVNAPEDELGARRLRRDVEVSDGAPNLQHLYDEPSAAHPEPVQDVEGDEDPEGP